jgi:dihydrofolate reductase
MIKLIWAQTKTGVIGKSQGLPWKIPAEMQHFQKTTWNQKVLMGMKTFESMNNHPLKNRDNYVLTFEPEKYREQETDKLHFLSEYQPIIDTYQKNVSQDIYIIGGNSVFELFFPVADEIIRTVIYQNYAGDLTISNFDFSNFKLVKTQKELEFEVQYFERIQEHD